MNAHLDRVLTIASDLFEMPKGALSADSTPESVESWDSLNHLSLVLALEQEFGVQLPPDKIEHLTSLGALAEVLGQKLS